MELTKQDFERLMTELNRIGNAVEVLAMHADPGFQPASESLRIYRREIDRRAEQTTTKLTPREPKNPGGAV